MADQIVNGGWFKFPNKAARILAKNGNAARVYIYLKSFARSKAGYALFYTKAKAFKVFLEEGQAICSRANIAQETGLTEREVRTSLTTLEKSNLLTIKATKLYSIVSFVNSDVCDDTYFKNDQVNDQQNANKTTNKTTTKQDDTNTKQNDKTIESSVADAPSANADSLPPRKDKPKTLRFIPPAVEEVEAYCRERSNGVDAQRFVDFYASKGWKIGKNSMKDWKAAVRTWENRNRENCFTGVKPQAQQPSLLNVQPVKPTYAPWEEIVSQMSELGSNRIREAGFSQDTLNAVKYIGGWGTLFSISERELSFKRIAYEKYVRGA